MNKELVKKTAIGVAKDVIAAIIVVAIIMSVLLAYCQVWPPVVVVESGSMMHGIDSEIGVIDTGDMVLVKDSPSRDKIVTYVEGEGSNYRTYDEFGDVIIYKPNGISELTPIIHRAVLWLELNDSKVSSLNSDRYDYENLSFDAPELGLYDVTSEIILKGYGYKDRDVIIGIEGIIFNFRHAGVEPHSGFVTMGDNNVPAYDQRSGGYMLIKEEWVVGRAVGELPWFGLIKLTFTGGIRGPAPPNSWPNLMISIVILIGVPLFIDFGLPLIWKKKGGEDEETIEEEGDGSEKTDENSSDHTPDPDNMSDPSAEDVSDTTIKKPTGEDETSVDVIKEKETIIIKEIVKIPCPHCEVLVENTESECPSCGRQLDK